MANPLKKVSPEELGNIIASALEKELKERKLINKISPKVSVESIQFIEDGDHEEADIQLRVYYETIFEFSKGNPQEEL